MEKENLWYKVLKRKYGKEEGKIRIRGNFISYFLKDIKKIELVGKGKHLN